LLSLAQSNTLGAEGTLGLALSLLFATRWAVAVVPVDPADSELAQNLSGVLEAHVTELSGAPVAASEELRAKLGLQGRGILGCVGDPSCLQHAGGALMIDRMVVVIVSRGVGDEYLLDMKLVEVSGGAFIGNELRHPKGVEALIRDAREVVTAFVNGATPVKVQAPQPLPQAPAPEPEKPPRRWLPLTVGGVGVAMIGFGTALAVSVGSDYDHLKKTCAPSCPQSSWTDLQKRANAGYAFIGIGAAAVAGGAVWWFLQPSGQPESRRAWIAPSPNGVVVGGVF
jgi:hypothetical protein